MRILSRKSSIPFVPIAAAFCLAILVLLITLAAHAHAAPATPSVTGSRLITLHDQGKDSGILTNATTLRAAFKDAGVQIDPNDIVEPGLDETLVANQYNVNVYRARPITVIDGAVRTKLLSAYQTPEQIVKHAAIQLQDEDTTTVSMNNDMVSQGAGLQLTIDRATPFTFVLYGKKITAYTQSTTVGDMLAKKNVKLASNDTLSLSATTPITPGMTVELWREGKQTITEDADMPFTTEKIQDSDHNIGYKEIKTPGVVGKRTVSYEIDMKNGKEVSRHEIQSVTTKEPVKQVEVIGTKVSLPPGTHQDWMAAAGIAEGDYGYVEYIISHEGGWCPFRWQGDPGCTNHGAAPQIGGYGLVQATPGGKMASAGDDWLTNPITQLRWATSYAVGRYGSWGAAYNHWLASHNW